MKCATGAVEAYHVAAFLLLCSLIVVYPFSSPLPSFSTTRARLGLVQGNLRAPPQVFTATLRKKYFSSLVCSTSQDVINGFEKSLEPEVSEEMVLQAQKPAARPAMRRELVDTIFQTMDINGDGAISKVEFLDAFHEYDPALIVGSADELFNDDDAGELSSDAFYEWASAQSDLASTLITKFTRDQAKILFEEIDTDGSNNIDAQEMRALASAMGIKWSLKQAEDVVKTIDSDGNGTVDFEEFFTWYSDQNKLSSCLASAAGAQLRLMLRKSSVVDSLRILVKGVPLKANEGVVSRFFGRCGAISRVRALPWARDGKPSGRYILTLADRQGVSNALKMHRKRLGPRFLEVYRVNQGDKEERVPLSKDVHGALIGVGGSHLQLLEDRSGARIFVQSNATDGWVVVKGTSEERAAAKQMIATETGAGGVESETLEVGSGKQGLVIGRGGRTIVRLEVESGAKVEVRESGAEGKMAIVISGLPLARQKAKVLLTELLETTAEAAFPLPKKFHGTLKGKRGVLVQALQAEMDASVQFDDAEGGLVRIRGPTRIRDKTWAMVRQLQREVPPVLTLLRGGAVTAGDLRSNPDMAGPVDDAEMWQLAASEAIFRAKAALAAADV